MGTVAGAEADDEGRCDESGAAKLNSYLSSAMQIADPVVYKLVRVEGDGRFVPATEDEVMEVEDFLADEEKIELPVIVDAANSGCISNEESSYGKPQKEGSEGLSHSENTQADAKISARLEETVLSSAASLDGSQICESQRIECSKPPVGPIESASSASFVCTSSKPDSSTSKWEMCLDNLSIRELQDLFVATFGRETTVKDKLWLKRRITMGLTNSCDVLTTTFTIINNKLVKKCKDDRSTNTDGMISEGSDGEAKNLEYETSPTSQSSQMENYRIFSGKRLGDFSVELDCGSDDLNIEERAAKRVRKPTKRYIEELSEVESRDDSPKVISSARNVGQAQTSPKSCPRPLAKVPSNERTIVTRLDSLGGTGVRVPYVSRIRRCRPRKNVMALMKFEPSEKGGGAELVKEALSVHSSLSESENADEDLKARPASERIKPLFTAEPEKHKCRPVLGTIELGKNMGLKQTDSSDDNSDHGIARVLTANGGMRRKHHRAWTLAEVTKLVEGVAKCGTGRWSEIKRLSSASFEYRTSVDLKDKWRNLLKASSAQPLPDDATNARKNASVPIPASILLKVRELAELYAQVPPNLGPNKLSSVGRTVQQTRPGFL